MTMMLCGCASGPRLSFPISVAGGLEGDVVSLKNVAQDGSGPVFQTARSVQVPQHWAQPQRTAGQPLVYERSLPAHQQTIQQQTRNQTEPQEGVAVPWIRFPVKISRFVDGSQNRQPTIRQVAQQQMGRQQSSPPLVIQWDDHKQSMGKTRTTRSFAATPFQAPQNGIPSSTGQPGADFCPPDSVPHHVVNRVGDGCGDENVTTDQRTDQIESLVKRVEKMEAELSSSRTSITDLSRSLAAARTEITQLKKDVGFWQSEVLRLERSMQAQHRSDIESLNRVSQILENLLQEDKAVTPAPIEEPPEFDLAEDPFAPVSR